MVATVPIPLTGDGDVNHVEWLRVRQGLQRNHFSASSAAALYDMHPFQTLGDVAANHLAPKPVDDRPNASQARGHYLEPGLLAWLADETGVPIARPTRMFVANGIAQTPDGEFVGSDTDQPEAKTTADYWTDGVPQWIKWQAVAQVAARPTLQRVHIVYLDASMRLQVEVVEPTREQVEDLIYRAERFMAFIGFGMIPEGVDLSERNVKQLWPDVDPESTIELTDTQYVDVAMWATERQVRLDAEKAEAAAKDSVAGIIRDHAVATYRGFPVATFRTETRGRVLRPTRHATAIPMPKESL